MARAVLAGQDCHWIEIGAGAPLLALHCSLAHGGLWVGMAAHLPGVRIVAPDLPGHGVSADWTGGAGFHDLCTRQAEALAEHAGAPLDLIGHSLGGTVALRLALERPDLIRSLALIEPVLFAAAQGSAAHDAYQAESDAFEQLWRAGDRAGAARRFHGLWGMGLSLDALPEAQRRYITDRIDLVPAAAPELMDDAAGMLVPGRLEALDRPVLLLEGSASPPVVGVIAERLAARLPDATRVVLDGAGHMLPFTHARHAAAPVRRHLDAVAGQGAGAREAAGLRGG